MNVPVWSRPLPLLVLLSGCGGPPPSPTAPSAPASFLAGTWRGTVTSEVNPGDPNPLPPSSGTMQWTLEAMPQTNLQSFRTTLRSDHVWLTVTTTATTGLTAGNTPPAQISTQGEFDSPRGVEARLGA